MIAAIAAAQTPATKYSTNPNPEPSRCPYKATERGFLKAAPAGGSGSMLGSVASQAGGSMGGLASLADLFSRWDYPRRWLASLCRCYITTSALKAAQGWLLCFRVG